MSVYDISYPAPSHPTTFQHSQTSVITKFVVVWLYKPLRIISLEFVKYRAK